VLASTHGNAPPKLLSLDAYREWQRRQPTRHELIAGEIVAMTGAHAGDVRMVGRLLEQLRRHLRRCDCEAFANALRLLVPLGDAF
jgi:Uma2 family endonuclease